MEKIRNRLAGVDDPNLSQAVRTILLHPGRKEVYDRNHRTVQLIGKLRSQLDLNDAPNWRETNAADFTRVSNSPEYSWKDWKKEQKHTDGSRHSYSTLKSVWSTASGVLLSPFTFVTWVFQKAGCLGLNLLLAGSIVAWVWLSAGIGNDRNADEGAQPEPPSVENSSPNLGIEPKPQSSFSEPAKSLPSTGTWWDYTSDRRIAPLRITVSEGNHYFVEVEEASTGRTALAIFIRSGETINLEVPTGLYRLKYAVGDTWYGRQHHFGPATRFFEAEETFRFSIVGQRVRGHRVELIVQPGGNLSTKSIPKDEF